MKRQLVSVFLSLLVLDMAQNIRVASSDSPCDCHQCLNGGTCIELRDGDYHCKCVEGFDGTECQYEVSVCLVYGNVHYVTFDTQQLDYGGICKHLLTETTANYTGSDSFQVYMRNELRDSASHVASIRTVWVYYGGQEVVIDRCVPCGSTIVPVTVTVNNASVQLPHKTNNFTLIYNANFVRFETSFGFVVEFDGDRFIVVKVPAVQFASKLRGMCGNLDGNYTNDLNTANGVYVGDIARPGDTIGRSYVDKKIANSSTCALSYLNTSVSCSSYDDSCATYCLVESGSYTVFNPCVAIIGERICGHIVNSTSDDACAVGSSFPDDSYTLEPLLFYCQLVRAWPAATGQCTDAINIYDPMIGSPKCQTNLIPVVTACSACQATCVDPYAEQYCYLPDRRSCRCPSGQIVFDGRCVQRCGCIDSNGVAHQLGTQWTVGCATYNCTPVNNNVWASYASLISANCSANKVCVGGQCVDPSTASPPQSNCHTVSAGCRCLNGGTCVERNGAYRCKCPDGYEGKQCQYRVSVCFVYGNVHYITFDKQRLDYRGVCRHLLTEPTSLYHPPPKQPQFHVYLQNGRRDGGQANSTFIRTVSIDFGISQIVIDRCSTCTGMIVQTTVTVNGKPVQLPFVRPLFSILYNANFVRFETSFGLVVESDGDRYVVVKLPAAQFGGKLHGMCGNLDGNTTNDLKTANGVYVGNQTRPGDIIGRSYVDQNIQSSSACASLSPIPADFDCPEPRPFDFHYCSPHQWGFTPDIFYACEQQLGNAVYQKFVDICQLYLCELNIDWAARILEPLAIYCRLNTGPASRFLLCSDVADPYDKLIGYTLCPSHLVPTSDECSACQATCVDPYAEQYCYLPDRRSCRCPSGQIVFDGRCVQRCGCIDSNGVAHQAGSHWSATCFSYGCAADVNCSRTSHIVTSYTCG